MLRLEHVFEVNESPQYSKSVRVNIKVIKNLLLLSKNLTFPLKFWIFQQDLFSGFSIDSIQETTLGANQWSEDVHRLKWHSEENGTSRDKERIKKIKITKRSISVTMKPMEIRTFIVSIGKSKDLTKQKNSENWIY